MTDTGWTRPKLETLSSYYSNLLIFPILGQKDICLESKPFKTTNVGLVHPVKEASFWTSNLMALGKYWLSPNVILEKLESTPISFFELNKMWCVTGKDVLYLYMVWALMKNELTLTHSSDCHSEEKWGHFSSDYLSRQAELKWAQTYAIK